jgi:serine/threonine protein kinase
MVGRRLGHYSIIDRLGRGGAGDVYLAEDTKLQRRVALKVLKPSLADDEVLMLSFTREAQALAALSHPGVVTVYSVEEADGTHFLTMELIHGRPLREMIPAGGMRLDAFLRIATPLADALATAHEHGIVHRDLKPRNVMVGEDGRVVVVDFGLAKLREASGRSSGNPTETLFKKGEIRGTIPYMSPEQVTGKPCGPPSDVFSLGTTFYMMLAGRRPFDGKNAIEIISRIVRVDPEPLASLRPDLPQPLVRMVRRAMAKEPERRHPSARQVHDELLDLAGDLESRETTRIERSTIEWLADDTTTVITIHGGRRRLALLIGAGLAAALAVALLVWLL